MGLLGLIYTVRSCRETTPSNKLMKLESRNPILHESLALESQPFATSQFCSPAPTIWACRRDWNRTWTKCPHLPLKMLVAVCAVVVILIVVGMAWTPFCKFTCSICFLRKVSSDKALRMSSQSAVMAVMATLCHCDCLAYIGGYSVGTKCNVQYHCNSNLGNAIDAAAGKSPIM